MSDKVKLTVNGLLEDLEQGLTRPEIAEKYGLSMSSINKAFKHPKLAGKKAKSVPKFILIDDEDEQQLGLFEKEQVIAPTSTDIEENVEDDKDVEDANIEENSSVI